jgi:hypothetical protein
MNDKAADNRGPRRAIALAVAAAAAAILASACSSSAPPPTSAPTYAQVLAVAQCIRGHGVPNFPDPNTSGSYTLTPNGSIEGAGGATGGSISIGSSQVQAAYGDCRHLLPGGPSISQLEQEVQQEQQRRAAELPELLKYSQCMRSHGVPNFPDFGGSAQSPPPGKSADINPNSSQFQAASTSCQYLLPAGAHVSIHTSTSAS